MKCSNSIARLSAAVLAMLCWCQTSASQELMQPGVACEPSLGGEMMFREDAPLSPLELLAVDIGRRTLLAHHPHAGSGPIRTQEVVVRPAGDVIHTYARLTWYTNGWVSKTWEAEVFAEVIYTPNLRRMYDLKYKDNYWIPHRLCDKTPQVVTAYNLEFERRDPLEMPHPLVGPRPDQLAPRKQTWKWSPWGDDQEWHVWNADDRVKPTWRQPPPVSPYGP